MRKSDNYYITIIQKETSLSIEDIRDEVTRIISEQNEIIFPSHALKILLKNLRMDSRIQ